MSFADMKRAWDALRTLPHELDDTASRQLADILVAEAPTFALEGSASPCTGARTDDTLLVLGLDADAMLCLIRIPIEKIHESLHCALECGSADELAAWAYEDGSSIPVEDVRALWNRWAECDVQRWDALVDVPARVCVVRRAM